VLSSRLCGPSRMRTPLQYPLLRVSSNFSMLDLCQFAVRKAKHCHAAPQRFVASYSQWR
jgi:hypothetical protein